MTQRLQQHAFPIIDILVKQAVDDIGEEGEQVSCRKGCNHCCHLLVEVSWSEAMEIAQWLNTLTEAKRDHFLSRIKENAGVARGLFSQSKKDKQYVGCVQDDETEISDTTHDQYFYGEKRPCPFLGEAGECQAYSVRPSACRMHLVTSEPALCAAEAGDDTPEYRIPDRVDEMREEIGPINSAVNQDRGWGHLAIMVELALVALENEAGEATREEALQAIPS